ncbi:hypothetical protein [Shewanella surugensis]|uniref:Nuclear transport factor 2 family protein n=1 Tax=Shewanella surugensis TaxID=212020 RepID=A0ABT0LEX8_9GAMM|nr:hypothetical protein [Shewanella surugensis]MCL1126256.1 hypothetical protein [Shewanella surugensis]
MKGMTFKDHSLWLILLFCVASLVSMAVDSKVNGLTTRVKEQFDLSGQYECISTNNKNLKEIYTNKKLTLSLSHGKSRQYQTYDINWVYSLNGQKIDAQAVAILQNETLSLSYNLHFPNNKTLNGVEVIRFNQLDDRWFLYGKWLRNDRSHNTGSISCVMLSNL